MRLSDILQGKESVDSQTVQGKTPYWVGYIRVSTEDQSTGQSLSAQQRAIREAAERDNAVLHDPMFEDHSSAFDSEDNRPAFWKAINFALNDPRVTHFVTHESSRFYRQGYKAEQLIEKLRENDIEVLFLLDPQIDRESSHAPFITHMMYAKNEAYSLDVSMHTRKGMHENIRQRDPETGFCYKNGCAPPWGLTAYKVPRGMKRNEPRMKTLWTKDETEVAGQPLWEWTRYVLIEMRLNGASLDAIANFLNAQGIPAARKSHWGTSTVRAMLQPWALLQYAGYGLWNVRCRRGKKMNPASKWEIIENAHPAIITIEEAEALMAVNAERANLYRQHTKQFNANTRNRGSRFLLSGGLFTCARCEEHITSFSNRGYDYYVCGAKRYRKGLGCGNMTQLPKEAVERAVTEEIDLNLFMLTDQTRLTKLIFSMWTAHQKEKARGFETAKRELAKVQKETANLLDAIKKGMPMVDSLAAELQRLDMRQKELEAELRECEAVAATVPTITKEEIEDMQHLFHKVMREGTEEEKRKFIRYFIHSMEYDPDSEVLTISTYAIPPKIERRPKKKNTHSRFSAMGVIAIGSGGGI